MADEIEIEVTEKDPKTGAKTKKKIKVTKKGKDGAVFTTPEKEEYELSGLKKNDPDPPKKGDKSKVSGKYSAPDFATDRDITIIVDCDADPPTVEVVVTYHDGSQKGERDDTHCKKYEIDPKECGRVKKFIHELDVPKMAFLGPRLNEDTFTDRWIGSALAEIGSSLPGVAAALQESRTEWLSLPDRTFAFVPARPGVSVLITRDGDEVRLTVRARPDVAPPERGRN